MGNYSTVWSVGVISSAEPEPKSLGFACKVFKTSWMSLEEVRSPWWMSNSLCALQFCNFVFVNPPDQAFVPVWFAVSWSLACSVLFLFLLPPDIDLVLELYETDRRTIATFSREQIQTFHYSVEVWRNFNQELIPLWLLPLRYPMLCLVISSCDPC